MLHYKLNEKVNHGMIYAPCGREYINLQIEGRSFDSRFDSAYHRRKVGRSAYFVVGISIGGGGGGEIRASGLRNE